MASLKEAFPGDIADSMASLTARVELLCDDLREERLRSEDLRKQLARSTSGKLSREQVESVARLSFDDHVRQAGIDLESTGVRTWRELSVGRVWAAYQIQTSR